MFTQVPPTVPRSIITKAPASAEVAAAANAAITVPDDDIGRLRWVADMVPRDAPDRLLRTAVQYCARCDMNHQFTVGLDLLIRGLEAECPAASH